jgi:hypothetical protein
VSGGLTPEQKARIEIDALVEAVGWVVQDFKGGRNRISEFAKQTPGSSPRYMAGRPIHSGD